MSKISFETEEEKEYYERWKKEKLKELDSGFSFKFYYNFSKEWNKIRNEVLNIITKQPKRETMDIFHIG